MDLEKALKTVEFEPIRSLNFAEMGPIVQKFSIGLINACPKQELRYEDVMSKMFECHMYLADMPDNFGTANYFYKNQTIYFKLDTDFSQLDDYIVHECIHYFQEQRNEKREIERIGLCVFKEFKIYCMALNEAAVQYITNNILDKPIERINYAGIVLETKSANYYPLLCNLIGQMAFLIGEEVLEESTLFGTDRFSYSFMDIIGEKAFKDIQAGFDKLLELKQTNVDDIDKQEKLIRELFDSIQTKIMTQYFDGAISLIDTIKEAQDYKFKIENYRKYMGDVNGFEFYEEYKNKQLEKLDKIIVSINKKSSKKSSNSLTVVKSNKILAFFRAIRAFLFKENKKSIN